MSEDPLLRESSYVNTSYNGVQSMGRNYRNRGSETDFISVGKPRQRTKNRPVTLGPDMKLL